MTRLWIFSDLHIEQSNWDFSSAPPAFDVMVAAGDIDQSPAHAINWLADRAEGKPVVYVPGNHEWYSPKLDTNVEAETRRGRRVAAERGVHFLMNEAVEVAGLRFLGATLWTDYEFGGDPAGSMALAERCINDHRLIYPDHSAARLSAAIAREWHRASRRWLEDELMVANTCPTVVVTHHLPHPRSVDPKYAGDPLNPAFCSDLSSLVEGSSAALWVHGHTHASCDYRAAGTRVVCNPKGYGPWGRHDRFENQAFDPCFVIDVGSAASATDDNKLPLGAPGAV